MLAVTLLGNESKDRDGVLGQRDAAGRDLALELVVLETIAQQPDGQFRSEKFVGEIGGDVVVGWVEGDKVSGHSCFDSVEDEKEGLRIYQHASGSALIRLTDIFTFVSKLI